MYAAVPEVLYTSQPVLMVISIHPYIDSVPYAVHCDVVIIYIERSFIWDSYLTWLMGYHGCHMTHGTKNMNYVQVQCIGNQLCLHSHCCLFLILHSMTNACHRMWITYGTVHEVVVSRWEQKEHLVVVRGMCDHNLYRCLDWNLPRWLLIVVKMTCFHCFWWYALLMSKAIINAYLIV